MSKVEERGTAVREKKGDKDRLRSFFSRHRSPPSQPQPTSRSHGSARRKSRPSSGPSSRPSSGPSSRASSRPTSRPTSRQPYDYSEAMTAFFDMPPSPTPSTAPPPPPQHHHQHHHPHQHHRLSSGQRGVSFSPSVRFDGCRQRGNIAVPRDSSDDTDDDNEEMYNSGDAYLRSAGAATASRQRLSSLQSFLIQTAVNNSIAAEESRTHRKVSYNYNSSRDLLQSQNGEVGHRLIRTDAFRRPVKEEMDPAKLAAYRAYLRKEGLADDADADDNEDQENDDGELSDDVINTNGSGGAAAAAATNTTDGSASSSSSPDRRTAHSLSPLNSLLSFSVASSVAYGEYYRTPSPIHNAQLPVLNTSASGAAGTNGKTASSAKAVMALEELRSPDVDVLSMSASMPRVLKRSTAACLHARNPSSGHMSLASRLVYSRHVSGASSPDARKDESATTRATATVTPGAARATEPQPEYRYMSGTSLNAVRSTGTALAAAGATGSSGAAEAKKKKKREGPPVVVALTATESKKRVGSGSRRPSAKPEAAKREPSSQSLFSSTVAKSMAETFHRARQTSASTAKASTTAAPSKGENVDKNVNNNTSNKKSISSDTGVRTTETRPRSGAGFTTAAAAAAAAPPPVSAPPPHAAPTDMNDQPPSATSRASTRTLKSEYSYSLPPPSISNRDVAIPAPPISTSEPKRKLEKAPKEVHAVANSATLAASTTTPAVTSSMDYLSAHIFDSFIFGHHFDSRPSLTSRPVELGSGSVSISTATTTTTATAAPAAAVAESRSVASFASQTSAGTSTPQPPPLSTQRPTASEHHLPPLTLPGAPRLPASTTPLTTPKTRLAHEAATAKPFLFTSSSSSANATPILTHTTKAGSGAMPLTPSPMPTPSGSHSISCAGSSSTPRLSGGGVTSSAATVNTDTQALNATPMPNIASSSGHLKLIPSPPVGAAPVLDRRSSRRLSELNMQSADGPTGAAAAACATAVNANGERAILPQPANEEADRRNGGIDGGSGSRTTPGLGGHTSIKSPAAVAVAAAAAPHAPIEVKQATQLRVLRGSAESREALVIQAPVHPTVNLPRGTAASAVTRGSGGSNGTSNSS